MHGISPLVVIADAVVRHSQNLDSKPPHMHRTIVGHAHKFKLEKFQGKIYRSHDRRPGSARIKTRACNFVTVFLEFRLKLK